MSSIDRKVLKRMLRSGVLCSIFVLLCSVTGAFAAAPQIAAIQNTTAAQGTTYTATPALTAGGSVRWSKEFGPDDMTVDPTTGAVSWAIPSTLPGESFHLGVKATNAEGSTYITWILKVGGGKFVYVGPGETYTTISAGTAAAASGDTVVVRDGVYTGATNMITNAGSRGNAPPSGSAAAYSTIMAEHPGGALIDGESARVPIYVSGNYVSRDQPPYNNYDLSYIAIKGFVCARANVGGPISIYHAHHIKVIDCGAYDQAINDSGAVIIISRSGYMLVEGCYTWGNGRYGVLNYICDYSIIRRCVVRIDRTNTQDPIGGIFHYCTQHGKLQNSVVIDSDQPQYYTHQYDAGAFDASSGGARYDDWGTTKDVIMANNIALNVYFAGLANTRNGDNPGAPTNQSDASDFRNGILYDLHAIEDINGDQSPDPVILTPGDININQVTIGKLRSYLYNVNSNLYINGYDGSTNKQHNLNNSIIFDAKLLNGSGAGLFYNWQQVDHNNIYDTGTVNVYNTSPTNTITGNPTTSGLKYLPRIEAGSTLATAGANGARVGANVMNMRGKSGTLWGESGYDTEGTAPMWPYPHEDLIKQKMATYTWDSGKLTGARGFCAGSSKDGSPQTLTKYIWEYLGNTIPTEIYGALPTADTTAPAVSITSPATGSSVTGTVSVAASASDAVGVSKVEFYVNGALQATQTAAPYVYSWNTSALAPGSYTLNVKAYDAAGNVGQASSTVSVVNDTTAPTATVTAPASGATVSGTTTISASAADNVGVSRVEIYLNGALLSTGNVTPFTYNWNTTATANGSATITAKAYDAAGNVGQSSAVTVTVNNATATASADTTAPTVAITAPSSGATVSGTTAVTASASDNVGVSRVEFYVDGALKSTATAAPYSYSWGTTGVANGTHTLSAKAYDAAGNAGQSSSVSVNVSNLAPIAYKQGAYKNPQSYNQVVTVSYPAAQTAGDLNIVVVGWNDTTRTVQSVKDSAGNVYSLAAGQASGTGLRQAIYYAKGIKGSSNSVTVTFSAWAKNPDIRILEYSGLSGTDKYVSASGKSSTSSSGSVTTTASRALLFSANTVSTGTSAAGSGYTKRILSYPDANIAQDRAVSSVGTYGSSAPLTSYGYWVMQLVAFK